MIAARQFCRAAPQLQHVRPFLNNNLPGTKPRTARLTLRLLIALQNVRRYATEGSPSGGMNKWIKRGGIAFGTIFVGFGVARALVRKPDPNSEEDRRAYEELTGKKLGHTSDKPAQKTFKGGDQGWLDLKLESVEQINHNTKKLRFALPDKDDVSGLQIACT